jgi:hypothetical protein
VQAFELAQGQRKRFLLAKPSPNDPDVTGLALTRDGNRLFVVCKQTVCVIDIRTGAITPLVTVPLYWGFRAGPVTSDPETSGGFTCAMGCVIDEVTRSLVLCDYAPHRLVRLRGVPL